MSLTIYVEWYNVTYDVVSVWRFVSVCVYLDLSVAVSFCCYRPYVFAFLFFLFLIRQMPMLMKSDVKDNAARVLPLSAIMNRLKVDSALHKVLMHI